MWFFKKQIVPKTNEIKEIDVIKPYIVEWESRYGEYSSNTQKEFAAFLNEQDANDFAESLKKAFELIRHTSGNKIKIREG